MRNIEYWAMLCEENADKIISKDDNQDVENDVENSNSEEQTTDRTA